MRRALVILAAVGLGAAIDRTVTHLTASAEECAPLQVYTPVGGEPDVYVQDMNGDGEFDPVTEAVALLSWYFSGGPAPVRPCTSSSSGIGLPDPAQTVCYDVNGNVISCSSTTFPGQDGAYATGCPPQDRFVDNQDGTVTDTCTGLMWQKASAPGTYNWGAALRYCDDLKLAGYTDWRLPNVREVQSIVDYARHDPSIDPVFDAVLDWYWSSSSYTVLPDLAWNVDFYYGYVYGHDKDDANQVRAVRTAE